MHCTRPWMASIRVWGTRGTNYNLCIERSKTKSGHWSASAHVAFSVRPRFNMRSRLIDANPHSKPTHLVHNYTRKPELSAYTVVLPHQQRKINEIRLGTSLLTPDKRLNVKTAHLNKITKNLKYIKRTVKTTLITYFICISQRDLNRTRHFVLGPVRHCHCRHLFFLCLNFF